MTSEQVTLKARETLKGVKELLEKAEAAAHKAISKSAPTVQKSLDSSLEAAGKGFSSTLKTIDSVTEKEQLELLKVYQRFLTGQADYVGAKIKSLEERAASKKA